MIKDPPVQALRFAAARRSVADASTHGTVGFLTAGEAVRTYVGPQGRVQQRGRCIRGGGLKREALGTGQEATGDPMGLLSRMTSRAVIQIQSRQLNRPVRVIVGRDFASRLRGMMLRPDLAPDTGMLPEGRHDARGGSSVHIFFVPLDLAIFWTSSNMLVADKVLARSRHPAYMPRHPVQYVPELEADGLATYEAVTR
jgi:uncharacterized membrane protein (UPF0127 family)